MRAIASATLLVCALLSSCAQYDSVIVASGVQFTLVEDTAWQELPDGRATATVHGDMTAGEHITYVRFPAGLRTAVHTHSNSYNGIVVRGTARHFEPELEDQSAWLMPGSFYQVSANTPHISECSEESQCIFAIHQHGAFDRQLVE